MTKSDEYRANAHECQRMADRTVNNAEKVQWLRLAQSWLRMLQRTDTSKADSFRGEEDARGTGQEDSHSSH
jgi:hypothetical protein